MTSISKTILLVGLFLLCCYIYSYDNESYTNVNPESNASGLKNWLKLNADDLYNDNKLSQTSSTKIQDLQYL